MSLPKFNFGYKRAWEDDINFNTLITQFESGKEQRRSKGVPWRTFRLNFEKSPLKDNEGEQIYQFFVDRKGRYEPFYWDYPKSDGSIEEVKVRFDMDTLSREAFLTKLYTFGLKFKEVI